MITERALELLKGMLTPFIVNLLHKYKSTLSASESENYIVIDMTKFFQETDENVSKEISDYVYNNGLSLTGTRAEFKAAILDTLQKSSVEKRNSTLGEYLLDINHGLGCVYTPPPSTCIPRDGNTHDSCGFFWFFGAKCNESSTRCGAPPAPPPCTPKLAYHKNGYVYFLEITDKSPYVILASAIVDVWPYADVCEQASIVLAGPNQPVWITQKGNPWSGYLSGYWSDPNAPPQNVPRPLAAPAALTANNPVVDAAIESGSLKPATTNKAVFAPSMPFTVPFRNLTVGEILDSTQFRITCILLLILTVMGIISYILIAIL